VKLRVRVTLHVPGRTFPTACAQVKRQLKKQKGSVDMIEEVDSSNPVTWVWEKDARKRDEKP
jgi:hypothetical protein